jgi:hypothetical protein
MRKLTRIIAVLTISLTVFFAVGGFAYYQEDISDELELPFFDDFSYGGKLPEEQFWVNKGTEISFVMAKNPPSTGVLVFDALDSKGKFYKDAAYSARCSGDTIESRPINLYYPNDKTIYLSFYYLAGGLGDRPEEGDSLCLDFYSPSMDAWFNVKRYEGLPQRDFKQEIINISEKKYLEKGFKFRFRNYFSPGTSMQPDLVSDCDFWLIDYVKLDINRSEIDTCYEDVSLTALPEIKIGDYQSVPWKHYLEEPQKEKLSYTIYYRNNDEKPRLLDSMQLILRQDTFSLGTYNMPSYMDFENNNDEFSFRFNSESADTLVCQMKVRIVSDVIYNDYPINNSVVFSKKFSDCYAYDDGTAEVAYGLYGEGSTGGLAAVKFHTLIPDRLNGVYIYFCPVFRDAQAEYFNLKVFNSIKGLPSAEIYSLDNVAVPKSETGKFVFFPFDELIQVTDTFFIGWEKLSPKIMAVGFDKNTVEPNNKFFNLNGTWRLSGEKGQIMMRPSFGNLKTGVENIGEGKKPQDVLVKIYPNPTTDYINIELKKSVSKQKFSVYSLSGKRVKDFFFEGNFMEIYLGDLPSGVYVVVSEGLKIRQKVLIIK